VKATRIVGCATEAATSRTVHQRAREQPLPVTASGEYLQIDAQLDLRSFKQELRWNDLYYHLGKGLA